MPRYSTILFDADNTLLDFDRSEREALLDALRFVGVTPVEEMIPVYSRINVANWKKLEQGLITKSALRVARFSEFCEYYGLDVDVTALSDAYTRILATKSYLIDGALEVCRALKPHCRLYVITNGIASVQVGRFDPSPLYPLFEKAFISEEIGVEKPARAFFDAVEAQIPYFDARDTLVVGDSLTSDIQGGINAGIDTCWFNRKGEQIPADMPINYVISSLQDLPALILCQ